ncbi:DUF3265 domain-containing protein [Vibrio vulnificus]
MVLVKRNSLKLKHNKAFKWDSCRVAFWVAVSFVVKVVCGRLV